MRKTVSYKQGLIPAICEHLKREFGETSGQVDRCIFCDFCSPGIGSDFRVLEFLETPDIHTPMLYPGIYRVEYESLGGSCHELRIRNLETDEVVLFDASLGHLEVESMVDWRGVVRWFPMRELLFPNS